MLLWLWLRPGRAAVIGRRTYRARVGHFLGKFFGRAAVTGMVRLAPAACQVFAKFLRVSCVRSTAPRHVRPPHGSFHNPHVINGVAAYAPIGASGPSSRSNVTNEGGLGTCCPVRLSSPQLSSWPPSVRRHRLTRHPAAAATPPHPVIVCPIRNTAARSGPMPPPNVRTEVGRSASTPTRVGRATAMAACNATCRVSHSVHCVMAPNRRRSARSAPG